MRLLRLFKREIAAEARTWVDEKIISPDQARAICDQYGIDYENPDHHRFAYGILLTLAFLFIGLALIVIIGENWESFSRESRTAGLFILTAGVQGLAIQRFWRGRTQAGVGLFFLGNLIYGASIVLIAQIYHLGEHMPDGIFWWALGSLPFALMTRSRLLMLQVLTLAVIWFFVELGEGFYPAYFPLFLAAAVFILARAPTSLVLFLATVLSTITWANVSLGTLWSEHYRFEESVELLPFTASLFVLMHAGSGWLDRLDSATARDYAAALSVWTLRGALLILFVLCMEDSWDEILNARWRHPQEVALAMGVILTLALGLAILSKSWLKTLGFSVVLLGLFTAVITNPDEGLAVTFSIACNLALVGAGIYLILTGIERGTSHYFFLGVGSILAVALLRYIDLVHDYIGAAVLFMVFAMILLGAAYYWRRSQRRREAASV